MNEVTAGENVEGGSQIFSRNIQPKYCYDAHLVNENAQEGLPSELHALATVVVCCLALEF